MNQNERLAVLEEVIRQMLRSVKNVPLDIIIKAISGKKIMPIDRRRDSKLVENIVSCVKDCATEIRQATISPNRRVNEVGLDIEEFVKKHLAKLFIVEKPTSPSGKVKSAGYPDILIKDIKTDKYAYIECKTYNKTRAVSSFRSFFLSPSEDFKISYDASHLVLSFEIKKSQYKIMRILSQSKLGYEYIEQVFKGNAPI